MSLEHLRLDRSPEQIERSEAQLVQVLGAAVVNELLDVRVRPEQEEILREVENRNILTTIKVELLIAATVPGGKVDPRHLGSDLPWAILVRKAIKDLGMARSIATSWFRHLLRLQGDDDVEVHPVGIAVAAYMTMEIEFLRRRFSSASRWAKIADAQVEFEPPPGLGLIAWARAAKLWTNLRDVQIPARLWLEPVRGGDAEPIHDPHGSGTGSRRIVPRWFADANSEIVARWLPLANCASVELIPRIVARWTSTLAWMSARTTSTLASHGQPASTSLDPALP